MVRCAFAVVLSPLVLLASQPARAGIIFDLRYQPAGGAGFGDPNLGQSRREAMARAAEAFDAKFDHDATIVADIESFGDSPDSTLASAGSAQVDGGSAGFNLGEIVRQKILTGIDGNGVFRDFLMLAGTEDGPGTRTFSPQGSGILRDLGLSAQSGARCDLSRAPGLCRPAGQRGPTQGNCRPRGHLIETGGSISSTGAVHRPALVSRSPRAT